MPLGWKPGGTGKEIMCIETGIVYNSIRDAAKITKISSLAIKNALSTGQPTNGFTWKYIRDMGAYAEIP
eukprot:g527.t1